VKKRKLGKKKGEAPTEGPHVIEGALKRASFLGGFNRSKNKGRPESQHSFTKWGGKQLLSRRWQTSNKSTPLISHPFMMRQQGRRSQKGKKKNQGGALNYRLRQYRSTATGLKVAELERSSPSSKGKVPSSHCLLGCGLTTESESLLPYMWMNGYSQSNPQTEQTTGRGRITGPTLSIPLI